MKSAGGDIRAIYDVKVEGKGDQSLPYNFFAEEYQLNYSIAKKKITQISLLNGITSNYISLKFPWKLKFL